MNGYDSILTFWPWYEYPIDFNNINHKHASHDGICFPNMVECKYYSEQCVQTTKHRTK